MPDRASIVLIIDDNLTNIKIIDDYLKAHGLVTIVARNGETGLKRAAFSQPDLILLDVRMPGIDGFETCRLLKANEKTKDIPVVFLTALTDVEDKVKGFAAGGVDYVTKPIQEEEVLARVNTHLALRNLQRQLEQQNAQLAAANIEITALNRRLDKFFRQFATEDVADALLMEGFTLGGKYIQATAMFVDIRDFTTITESQPPELTIELLNDYYAHIMEIIGGEGGVINQIMGDGIMCLFGAPVQRPDHPHRAARAALKILERLNLFNQEQAARGRVQIRIGAGLATGTGIAGCIGTQTRANYTWISNATNLAYRLETHTKLVGKPILIDEEMRIALGDGFQVHDEGWADIRGKTQLVHIFSVSAERA